MDMAALVPDPPPPTTSTYLPLVKREIRRTHCRYSNLIAQDARFYRLVKYQRRDYDVAGVAQQQQQK
ncbi:hypothetical protein M0802_011811 [Mischocyttarus mexicanus]|nr:hypothetical protein M0802_011811 [Mischocyttarus mexicanus]